MKSIRFTHKFFTFLILTGIIFCFNGCEGPDPVVVEPSSETFLEIYDNTIWSYFLNYTPRFVKFQNNLKSPFEYYIANNDNDCFMHTSLINLEILTNSETTFKVKLNLENGFSETFTFSVNEKAEGYLIAREEKQGYLNWQNYVSQDTEDNILSLVICN